MHKINERYLYEKRNENDIIVAAIGSPAFNSMWKRKQRFNVSPQS